MDDVKKPSADHDATPPKNISDSVENSEQATDQQDGGKDGDPASHAHLMKAILADASELETTGGVEAPSSGDVVIGEGSGGVEEACEGKDVPQENADKASEDSSHPGKRKRKQEWASRQKLKKRKV